MMLTITLLACPFEELVTLALILMIDLVALP